MHQKFLSAALICLLAFASCKKEQDEPIVTPTDESTVTPVGTPTGAAIQKTIDQRGGELTSADGTIKLVIPAGALESAKEISVQPLSNELPGGIGNAFRILPHGQQFKKPVTIQFRYKQEDEAATIPEFLDIAYQDTTGTWNALLNSVVDKTNRTLTVTTTHFSDWGFFKSLTLTPEDTTVFLSQSVDLKAETRFPYVDPDDQPAGEPVVKVLKEPRALRSHELKKWSYQGDGILISRGSEAFYTAPDEEPETNPEAVVAEINMHRKGQFMLVSNITVLSERKVYYLHVDEDFKSPLNNGSCMLTMYGNFGADPGAARRAVKINGTAVEVSLWAPDFIRCKIDREISGAIDIIANNKTIVRSTLRKFTGTFVYERFQGGKTNSRSTNPLKELTEFKIVYRGFGAPCPSNVNPLFLILEPIAAFGTRADYSIGGSATVTTPTQCPVTTSVTLPATSSVLLHNTLSESRDTRLLVNTEDVEGGIDVKIQFRVVDVITGVKVKRSNCNSTSFDMPTNIDVSLEGFSYKTINLVFTENGGLKLKGTNELKSGNMASDILIEAWDGTGNPSHYETDGLMPATFKNK